MLCCIQALKTFEYHMCVHKFSFLLYAEAARDSSILLESSNRREPIMISFLTYRMSIVKF